MQTAAARVLVAVAALTLLAAGCGGNGASRAEFQTEMIAARDRVDEGLAQVTRATSVDDLMARLKVAAAEVRSASQDVSEAKAPAGLTDQKRALATTLREFADEIVATVETLKTLGGTAASTRGLDFAGWNKVQARLAALRKAGIQVPPLRKH